LNSIKFGRPGSHNYHDRKMWELSAIYLHCHGNYIHSGLSIELNWMKGRPSIRTDPAFPGVGMGHIGADEEPTGAWVLWVGGGVQMIIPSGVCGDVVVFVVRT
jgi:hypothetical protein